MNALYKNLYFVFFITVSINYDIIGNTPNNVSAEESIESIFDRLSKKEVLEITVRTDIDRLINQKIDSKYQAAFITIKGVNDNSDEWRVELKPRGKYRKRACEFPPLKIKFDHSVLGPQNLKAFKYLKLVTHCGDQAEIEELLQKEYLAYKIFNTVTDNSYRVQLIKINWIDSHGSNSLGEKWGFIIENEDELANRMGGAIYDEYGVTPEYVNRQSSALNSVFQYMIGNTDWNLETNKNVSFVKSNFTQDIWVVPYDFDFSGFVDASYAVPRHGLYNNRERIFTGDADENELDKARDLFKSKEKEIMELIETFPYMSRSKKVGAKKYIKSFYESLYDPFLTKDDYKDRVAIHD